MSTEISAGTGRPGQTAGSVRSPGILNRILTWLTAGYPEGIPPADRFPVVAVLKRRLTDDDIRTIVAELTADDSAALADGAIGRDEVEELLARVLHEQPTDVDIRRVSAHLAAGGWPLAWSGSDGSDGYGSGRSAE